MASALMMTIELLTGGRLNVCLAGTGKQAQDRMESLAEQRKPSQNTERQKHFGNGSSRIVLPSMTL